MKELSKFRIQKHLKLKVKRRELFQSMKLRSSLYLIKELLGNKDIRTIKIYAYPKVYNVEEAVKVLEA
jgi:hypothetical protein